MTTIRAIIFDLDNVLVASRQLHYEAFAQALLKVTGINITWEEHCEKYDGMTTKKKLETLVGQGLIQESHKEEVSALKQQLTREYLPKHIHPSARIMSLLMDLRSRGYNIACASNSVRYSVIESLKLLGVHDLFDSVMSCEDVTEPKPHPEIYIKTMAYLNVQPSETLIVEDSPCGIAAARVSGASVLIVKDPYDTTIEKINMALGKN